MHHRHAEAWEGDVTRWRASDRMIEMSSPDIGYYVDLQDGNAEFRCETADAYMQALRHAVQLVGTLVRERHERAIASIDAQHLLPIEEPFETLVSRLDEKLLNDSILRAVNARLFDFAYLVDTRINGRYYQFNIGAVRDREIPSRVAARNLTDLPAVALFCSIATKKRYEYELDDLSSYVLQTINIGNTILSELSP